MKQPRKAIQVSLIVLVLCGIMAVIDGFLKVNYLQKSIIKLVLFLCCPIIYLTQNNELKCKTQFIFNKKSLTLAIALGLGVFTIICGGYFLLKDIFDFSGITKSLTENIGVNRENFVYVSLYISFVNSLLEEFLFRGFAFLTLRQVSSQRFAHIFSASIFSLYHVAMMIGWFSSAVFLLVLSGLFAGGILFNYLNVKSGTIYPSCFVHMFANFAINFIGFILFGIF